MVEGNVLWLEQELPRSRRVVPPESVGIVRRVRIRQAPFKECFYIRPTAAPQAHNIRIELVKKQRTDFRRRSLRPESTHLHLFENVIAGKKLVCTFTGHDNFELEIMNQSREQEHWHRRGAEHRRLRMPDDVRERASNIGMGTLDNVMISAQMFCHLSLKVALVKFRVVGKRDGKRIERSVRVLADDGCCRRRIQTAAQISAHRHIRAQSNARRIDQQTFQLCDIVRRCPGRIFGRSERLFLSSSCTLTQHNSIPVEVLGFLCLSHSYDGVMSERCAASDIRRNLRFASSA